MQPYEVPLTRHRAAVIESTEKQKRQTSSEDQYRTNLKYLEDNEMQAKPLTANKDFINLQDQSIQRIKDNI